MSRPLAGQPRKGNDFATSIRFPENFQKRLVRFATRISARTGYRVTASDIIRQTCAIGLEKLEKEEDSYEAAKQPTQDWPKGW